MKRIRRILAVAAVTVILAMVASPVLATSLDITGFKAFYTDKSDTQVSLLWVKSSYARTIIRYSTTSYPATIADGTSVFTLGYSLITSYIQTGLTAGTTYYYSAWGWDGGINYSPDVANVMITTTANSGTSDVLPTPPVQTPTAIPTTPLAWFDGLQPFSGFVLTFEQSWGMQTNEMPFTMGILILLAVGIGLYLKTHSPLVAIVADFVVDFGLIALGLLSPYTIAVVLAFGLGVWALENVWI